MKTETIKWMWSFDKELRKLPSIPMPVKCMFLPSSHIRQLLAELFNLNTNNARVGEQQLAKTFSYLRDHFYIAQWPLFDILQSSWWGHDHEWDDSCATIYTVEGCTWTFCSRRSTHRSDTDTPSTVAGPIAGCTVIHRQTVFILVFNLGAEATPLGGFDIQSSNGGATTTLNKSTTEDSIWRLSNPWPR